MANDMLFRGTAPALVTPFTNGGEVDYNAFRQLVNWQIEEGVEALVVLGTTGENPTITPDEREKLVDAAVEETDGRVPVIIGTGTNNTQQSVRFSEQADDAGADGLLVVGPYYNKPPARGFKSHVAAIADASDLDIIIYNVPGRTGYNVLPETVLELAEEIPTVTGVKEASGDIGQITDILAHRPDDLAVYAGDDEMTLPIAALGGDGVVSVISNVLPGRFSEFVRTALADDIVEARAEHLALLSAMRACFYDCNPLPVKAVLSEMGRMEDSVRLPLQQMESGTRERVLSDFRPLLK